MNEYLVELYVSCADAGGVARATTRAKRAARDLTAAGTSVRFVRSIVVPAEETCLFLFEAPSIDDVRAAGRRAALRIDHVVETAPSFDLTLEET